LVILLIAMNLFELTTSQLRRAVAIKEQIERLNKELRSILLGGTKASNRSIKKRTMSAAGRKRIAVAQKRRWANLRRAKAATKSVKVTAKGKV
jgi:preprotein translocase subunit YajC